MKNLTKKRATELFKSIECGGLENAREFVETYPERIDILGVGNRYFLDKTPLMYALQCANYEVAGFLIDKNADVNAVMPEEPRWSVLYFAVYTNVLMSVDILGRLLSAGANPNVPTGPLPLSEAIENSWRFAEFAGGKVDFYEAISLLLRHGADLDYTVPSEPDTESWSARKYAESCVELPDAICDLLSVAPKSSHEIEEIENPILEHPNGQFSNAQTALEAGLAELAMLQSERQDWVSISIQGGTESGIVDHTFHFHAGSLDFLRGELTNDILRKCRPKVSPELIEKDTSGNCVFTSEARKQHIAAVLLALATHKFSVPKFKGDYAVGIEWAPDFSG